MIHQMAVDREKFIHWVKSRFEDVAVTESEVKINSIFCEDYKKHLWCNPSKEDRPYGVYKCWKTETKGNLVGLVMRVDSCSFEDAISKLNVGEISLEELEERLKGILPEQVLAPLPNSIALPEHTHLINDLPNEDYFKINSEAYLLNRKIPPTGLYVCTEGTHFNRIIIPYHNKKGQIYYFNGRYIGTSKTALRYLGPPKEIGIGKSDVVFMTAWPEENSWIYMTEGEFDAISLGLCGFKAGAFGGKSVHSKQIELIRNYKVVLCFDGDKHGLRAIIDMGKKMIREGIKDIKYVHPPGEYKDWNEVLAGTERLKSYSPNVIRQYILNNETQFDLNEAQLMELR